MHCWMSRFLGLAWSPGPGPTVVTISSAPRSRKALNRGLVRHGLMQASASQKTSFPTILASCLAYSTIMRQRVKRPSQHSC